MPADTVCESCKQKICTNYILFYDCQHNISFYYCKECCKKCFGNIEELHKTKPIILKKNKNGLDYGCMRIYEYNLTNKCGRYFISCENFKFYFSSVVNLVK